MASQNALKTLASQTALYKKKYKAFFGDFCKKNYDALIGAIQQRTPVDFGVLREGWAQNSSMSSQGQKVVFTIYNPSDYAAHVEYGYHQKPGMILLMEMRMGRLRFVKYLGQTKNYGTGGNSNKASQPNKKGLYTIVTQKKFVPGRHMLGDSVTEFKQSLPERYAKAFDAFNKKNGPWKQQ